MRAQELTREPQVGVASEAGTGQCVVATPAGGERGSGRGLLRPTLLSRPDVPDTGPPATIPSSAAAGERLDFTLPPELEAHEPAEARGDGRDDVRLLVSRIGTGAVSHHRFADLPDQLAPGDVLVVNVSGTLPAAVDIGDGRSVNFSTEQPGGDWVVELRRGGERDDTGRAGDEITMPGGHTLTLRAPYSPGRLWVGALDVPSVTAYLAGHGRPIRYGYVRRDWPLDAYQTVFATEPGSAEMPSAARPFTAELVTRLVSRGVVVAPLTLHTGVASPEAHEKPYPEWYSVPASTARVVASARASGARVVAVGTTVVRALETVTDTYGRVTPGSGWTDLVVTPDRGVRAVDGLLTGLHEPRASHLLMLEAVAGRGVLRRTYSAALAERYLWHEFGDVNLIIP
ncbi:MAG: S-adenosylmethionine:tRNA ribosyltransferase-isomerase [Streptosporangiales bacterium]|nr:S-adenosylmethionine:tRNA ribosyltransferase-isomerase [Streptosporangiales bacterium]